MRPCWTTLISESPSLLCLAQTLCVVRPNLDSELFDVRHLKVVAATAKIEISAGKEVGVCCVSMLNFE